MAGLGVKLFTDEDVDARLAEELRERGYDAVSCVEVGRANQRIPDAEQLQYAAEQGRAILVFNIRDYVPLDAAWKAGDRHHAGIIASPKIADLGELLRRVMRHLDTTDLEVQRAPSSGLPRNASCRTEVMAGWCTRRSLKVRSLASNSGVVR